MNLEEHSHSAGIKIHTLTERAEDTSFADALQVLIQKLEGAFENDFGIEAGTEQVRIGRAVGVDVHLRSLSLSLYSLLKDQTASVIELQFVAMHETAKILKSTRGDSAGQKYHDELNRISKSHSRGELPLPPPCLTALCLLRGNVLACLTAGTVGFEVGLTHVGTGLLEALQVANSDDAADDHDVCHQLVDWVLSSPVCGMPFVGALLPSAGPSTTAGVCAGAQAPKLLKLRECLLDANPLTDTTSAKSIPTRELRGIVFVRERTTARRIVSYLQADSDLQAFVRPAVFTGRAGMTTRAQEEARVQFDSGKVNLLISTSVAEEGMNVQACNFGCMMDSVFTGTALIQCKVGAE